MVISPKRGMSEAGGGDGVYDDDYSVLDGVYLGNLEEFEGLQELHTAGQQFAEMQEEIQSSELQKAAKAVQDVTLPESLATTLAEQRKSFAPVVEAVRSTSVSTGVTMPYLPSDVVDSVVVSFPEHNHPFYAPDSPALEAFRAIGTVDLSQYAAMFESFQSGGEVARTVVQFTEELEQIAYLVNTGVVSPVGATPTGAPSSQSSATPSEPTVDPETPSHPFADLLFSLKRADPSTFDPVVPEQPEPKIDRELLEDIVEYCTGSPRSRYGLALGVTTAIAIVLLLQGGTRFFLKYIPLAVSLFGPIYAGIKVHYGDCP